MSLITQRIVSRIKYSLQNMEGLLRFRPAYRGNWALFLLPVFFVLHGANENFGIIPLDVLADLLLKYVMITALVLIACMFWFKSPDKALLFSAYLMCWYFFFGAFYDMLKHLFPGSVVYSYKFLLPFLLLLSLIVYWLLHRRQQPLNKITRYAVLTLLLFTGIEIVVTGYHILTDKEEVNDLSGSFKLADQETAGCTGPYPDIYFVVFDSYTSSAVLKNDFNYDNSYLDSALTRSGYYVAAGSRSNYNFTAFSLASMFNMDYLKPGVEKQLIYPKQVLQAVGTLDQNNLLSFLKARGYEFSNYGRFETEHMPSEEVAFFDYFYHGLIDNQVLISRIRKDIGWNLFGKNLLTGKFKVPERYTETKMAHINRNQQSYDSLLAAFNRPGNKPRFVYSHLMLPHEPFYLQADGSMANDSAIIFGTLDEKKGYVNQVEFSNMWIRKIAEASASGSSRPRIVIIQGDHGFRFWKKDELDKEFPILNSYYFSDGDYSLLYDSISPVNSFRVVMNKYFCRPLPLLPDSSLYLQKPEQ